MTLREALVTGVEALREHCSESPRAQRAAAVLEKKADRLRERREALAVKIDAADWRDRPLRLPRGLILANFKSAECPSCFGAKTERTGFCARCFGKLPAEIRTAMNRLRLSDGWEQAFEAGEDFLAAPFLPPENHTKPA